MPRQNPYVALETIRDITPQLIARLEPMIYAVCDGAGDLPTPEGERTYWHPDTRKRADAVLAAVADALRSTLRDELDDEWRVVVGDQCDPFDRDWAAWGKRAVALAQVSPNRERLIVAKEARRTGRETDQAFRVMPSEDIEAALAAEKMEKVL